jgi:hypothetical protein
MNTLQIKDTLRLYRPGTGDERDPEMAAAIIEATRDPEINEWFAEHQAFNRAVREKLRRLQPPADLKGKILRGRPRAQVTIWWRQPQILAMAAVFVLLMCLTAFWLKPREENLLAGFQMRMTKFALTRYSMDLATSDMRQIRTYLKEQGGHGDFASSPELDRLPGAGCALLKWRNKPVSMVCYRLDANQMMWLFVIDRDALINPPAEFPPAFQPVGKLITATWTRQGKTYLLAGIGGRAMIEKYLTL